MFSDGPRYYQPHITRLPSLISLLTITLALIAVIEIACRRLPARQSDYIGSPINLKLSRDLDVRIFARNGASSSSDESAGPTNDGESLSVHRTFTASSGAVVSPSGGSIPLTDGKASQITPTVQPTSVATPALGESTQVTGTATGSSYMSVSVAQSLVSSNYLSIETPVTPPKIYSTANPSDYLPVSTNPPTAIVGSTTTQAVAPSDYLSVTPSITPPNPSESSSPTTIASYVLPPDDLSVGPSITPPIIPSSLNPNDYLPVTTSPSEPSPPDFLPIHSNDLPSDKKGAPTPHPYPSVSGFLPIVQGATVSAVGSSNDLGVGPSIIPPNPSESSSPTTIASYVLPPNDLNVGPSITPPIIYSTANPNDYLPVTVSPSEPTPSDFLPIPSDDLPISGYLPITPGAGSAHGDSLSLITPVPTPTGYLPISPSNPPDHSTRSSYLPYILTRSLYLPVDSDSIAPPPPPSAFLPVSSLGQLSQTVSVGEPAPTDYLPVTQNENSRTSQNPNGASPMLNSLPIPSAVLAAGNSGPFVPITQPPRTGTIQGESYSIGTNGVIIIGGKSFATNLPTTATLANGKVIIVGPSGAVVQDAPDTTSPIRIDKSATVPATGVFQGEAYVFKPSGVVVIGGKTLSTASPTTATLADGRIVIMGPSGASFQDSPDVNIPIGIPNSANSPSRTGEIQGEHYSIGSNGVVVIGGKILATASPTTATLADGRIVIMGPSGASFQDSPDVNIPIGIPNSANSPSRTGEIQGEQYSIGSNGVVVLGGKTFTLASPTIATLADGKIVIVGPSGISVQDGHYSAVGESISLPPQTGTFHGETYSVGPSGTIFIGGKSFATASPTTATLSDGKIVIVEPSGVSVQDALNSTTHLRTWVTPSEYVIGGILPTVIAVIFSIPWHLLALAVNEIQPFYQLHHPDGVTAQDSIGLDYRYSISAIATFTAIRKGHYLVWWSGLISMVILFVAPLAAGSVFIGFTGLCTATSGRQNCFPKLSVYPFAARILQGVLSVIAILTLFLAIAIWRRRSGVFANPWSIAALATLFQDQHVLEDFRRLNPYYTNTEMIRDALRGNRYQIGPYTDDEGNKCYGFTKCHDDNALTDPIYQTSFRKGQKYASISVTGVEDHQRPKKNVSLTSLFIHPAAIIAFAIIVSGLGVLVIYYNRTGGNTGFEKFMDSQSFGVSFLFTAAGVILKMYWSLLDEETRNMEPYRQLLTNGAKAGDSILLAPHSNPYTGIFYSLRNGHFFNAYLSLIAILCEPLIVALADIPFKASSVFTAYRVSTYISIGVLSMMLIGIMGMLCRKRTPELIRRPDTIASILLFLCGSNMLEDFKGMSRMRRNQRDDIVKCWDKNYAMGSVIGVDGVEREGIDESLFVTAQTREG